MLVSTVTAMTSGGDRRSRAAVSWAASRAACRRDRVGDVVELQVEEDATAAARQRANDVGAFCGEEAAADLESADDVAKVVRESERREAVFDIQCN